MIMNKLTQLKTNKIVAIHQPNFIPWLGYFYKIYQSDVFVFLDNVQYSNKGMHDFHYIKNPQGRLKLKIPVKASFGDSILDVRLNNELKWKQNQLQQLESNYKKAPYFKEVFQDIQTVFNMEDEFLSAMNMRLIELIASKFGIETTFVKSSDLCIVDNEKNDRIFSICKKINATIYYSGTGAAVYQDAEVFKLKGIELRYSTFKPFAYPQFWGDFESNISILDFLMHCGYDWNLVLNKQL
jgi:hypothetical protein